MCIQPHLRAKPVPVEGSEVYSAPTLSNSDVLSQTSRKFHGLVGSIITYSANEPRRIGFIRRWSPTEVTMVSEAIQSIKEWKSPLSPSLTLLL